MRLRVEEADTNSLRFANGFRVTVEKGLSDDERERSARGLVLRWLKERALHDAKTWVRRYGPELGAFPSKIRIGNQKTLWGSCSARGVISLNWRLVAARRLGDGSVSEPLQYARLARS